MNGNQTIITGSRVPNQIYAFECLLDMNWFFCVSTGGRESGGRAVDGKNSAFGVSKKFEISLWPRATWISLSSNNQIVKTQTWQDEAAMDM